MTSPGTSAAAPTARIDGIGLVASDVATTVDFYRALGCDVPASPGDDPGHVEFDLGGFHLMLDSEEVMRSFATDTWSGPSSGRLTLAARCDSPVDVDRLHDVLAAMGGGSLVTPFDAPWGQRYATVLDPDGVRVDLYAALPSATES